MNYINEAEFRQMCHAVFDSADSSSDESALLQQLLMLTRHRVGQVSRNSGFLVSASSVPDSLREQIVGLLLMRREPFFDTNKVLGEFLERVRKPCTSPS
jgi:hypothetical protein